MASKSKKRRRVFRASCILAALIIAGSSFAWFTSKDEVTNRLTAQADYGVSIVESFTPPENWLPGQEVNKDVYAVNTGNVGAFVEESVSGVLTITKEKATDTLTENSIELTAAERYVVEAGAFLAYKPTNSNAELGRQVVSMVPDATNLDGYEAVNTPLTDFAPDAPGLYVFRRTISVDPETRVEQYTYDGYYYAKELNATTTPEQVVGTSEDGENEGKYKWLGSDNNTYWTVDQTPPSVDGVTFTAVTVDVPDSAGMAGKFYKISNLKVTYPDVTLAGDIDPTDGILAAAEAGFCEDETTVASPIDLQYDATNKRLVATYNTNGDVDYTDLATLAEAYDDAMIAYEDALEEYRAAARDAATSDATLAGKYKTLQEKLDALQAALNAQNEAQKDLTNAQADLDAAEAATQAAQTAADSAVADLAAAQTALSDATTADSNAAATVTAKTNALNIAQGNVDTQQDVFDAVPDTAREAFVQYLVDEGEITSTADADVEAYFNTVTYDHLHDELDIDNTDVGYDYYQQLVELKRLESLRDAAQADLDAAQATKRATARALAAAQAAYDAADAANTAAQQALSDAQAEEQAADDAVNNSTSGAQQAYDDAVADTAAAQAAVDSARAEYEAALTDANADSDQFNDAKANLIATTQALADAKAAYESAAPNEENSGVLKININLSDDVTAEGGVADKWQILPDYITDDTAYFYYTGILEGGETSAKLIDSVELDSSVTEDMFKYFDFDLNVALKSAQIAYDADGNITTDAATELDATATVVDPTSIDTAITWSPTAP